MAVTWVRNISGAKLAGYQVIQAYETVLKMQLIYRLPVYSLTFDECDEIVKVYKPTLLHAMSLTEKYSSIILHADQQYAGLNIPHLYDLQGAEKTKFFLLHMRRKDTTGKLIRITREYTQMECGSKSDFLQLDYERWKYLITETWMTHLWEYWNSRGVIIDTTEDLGFMQQRENDECIMDVVMRSKLSNVEKMRANLVRQDLKIIMLSDIVDGRGRIVLDNIRIGKRARDSHLTFRRQQIPESWRRMWRDKVCPVLQHVINRAPLGIVKRKSHQIWSWKISDDNKFLSSNRNMYKLIGSIKNGRLEKDTYCVDIRRRSSRCADVRWCKGEPKVIAVYPKIRIFAEEEQNDSFFKYRDLWGKVDLCGYDFETVLKMISENNILGATDGSNKNGNSVCAWGIGNKDGDLIVKGRNQLKVQRMDANSTRSEIVAILAFVTYISHVVAQNDVKEMKTKKIPVYVDSKNAIECAYEEHVHTMKSVVLNDIDVRLELETVLKNSPLEFSFLKVKAHQDKKKEIHELTLAERMNIQIDEYAADYHENETCDMESNMITQFFQAQIFSIRLYDCRPTSNIFSQIWGFKRGHEAEEVISKVLKIPKKRLTWVEWKGLKRAIVSQSRSQQFSSSKFIYSNWHTMQVAKRNGKSDSDICPLCKSETETWEHVLRCDATCASTHREKEMMTFKKNLRKMKTKPVLLRRIVCIMRQWLKSHEIITYRSDEVCELERAIQMQMEIGVNNMFKGFVCTELIEIQDRYYEDIRKNTNSHNTIDEWSKLIVLSLLDFSKSMWRNRCEIVNQHDLETVEIRTRNKAWELCQSLRTSFFLLSDGDKHLGKREKQFFDTAPMINIHTWMTRVRIALNENATKKKKWKYDIRTWMTAVKEKNGKKTIRTISRSINRKQVNKKIGKNRPNDVSGDKSGTIIAYLRK